MMTIGKVDKLLKEIRPLDLNELATPVKHLDFCTKHRIKGGELNFLISVVSTERFREENIRLKKEILARR